MMMAAIIISSPSSLVVTAQRPSNQQDSQQRGPRGADSDSLYTLGVRRQLMGSMMGMSPMASKGMMGKSMTPCKLFFTN